MPELSNVSGRIANRLFFGSFFSTEKKEHVPPRTPRYPIVFSILKPLDQAELPLSSSSWTRM